MTFTFPGLNRYILTAEDEVSLNEDFRLVCSNANLIARENGDICEARTGSLTDPGVYFWTLILASITYKIYIGKTKSLHRRVSDYIKEFQPHSPNDFKLRIFQQVVTEQVPEAIFQLHFTHADLTKYTKFETDAVHKFCPLLNERGRSTGQTKDAFRNAFEIFYRQGFEEQLSNGALL